MAGFDPGLPRFDIPSASPTPGSVVYPPEPTAHYPIAGIPGAVRVRSRGYDIQLKLYGWLRKVRNGFNCSDPDGGYYFEVDTAWARQRGIDLHQLYRVGNIAADGIPEPGFWPRRAVAEPVIHLEVNGWGFRGRYPRVQPGVPNHIAATWPADWTFTDGQCQRRWPFDPLKPSPANPATLMPFETALGVRGSYVRVVGSLVTDSPHDVGAFAGWFSRFTGISVTQAYDSSGAVSDWHPGVASSDPRHHARWTEVHPLDLIEVVNPGKQPNVNVRGIALAARVAATPGPIIPSCEEASFTLAPPTSRPSAAASLRYEELIGPETYFSWGQDANNGSWVTYVPFAGNPVAAYAIMVRAKVCGGALGGPPGRFKALYRVWWQ